MAKTAWIFSYKLRKNVTKEEFIECTQKLHDEVISKAKGFLSWEHYLQDQTWTDFVLWETEEDAKNATTVGQGKEVTEMAVMSAKVGIKRRFHVHTLSAISQHLL